MTAASVPLSSGVTARAFRTAASDRWRSSLRFVTIAVQLGTVLALIKVFRIEPETGLLDILPLIFVGFVVHAALPMRFRLPFFVLLSIACIGMVLGAVPTALILSASLVLVGVCHLPIAFWIRVMLLLLLAGCLAAIRAGALPVTLLSSSGGLPRIVIQVLASMFMFRLIIYMYDLRHDEKAHLAGVKLKPVGNQPQSVWTRVSYFLLLPNVCFLLFPIIDYRTFRRTYYDSKPNAIYQKGVWWMCLGVVQLLLYRVVYQYLVPSPEEVQGIAGIARFTSSAYLIYLRVVGQFQLIMGILCLFGFNLPPAHRFYLLASSFTDFWRRARIEWKDFMVKIFYYPALVPLQRRLGAMRALIIATIAVFVATWLLHGYQWFWLTGSLRLFGTDGVFWIIIGACVLVNSVLEARTSRARQPTKWNIRVAVLYAVKVVMMFVFMCLLWSYWSSPSFAVWYSYMTALENTGVAGYMAMVGVLVVVIGIGVFAQYARSKRMHQRTRVTKAGVTRAGPLAAGLSDDSRRDWRPIAVLAIAAALMLVSLPATGSVLGRAIPLVIATVTSNDLNAVDQEREDRGYYEELLDVPRSSIALGASRISVNDTSSNAAAVKEVPATSSDTSSK